MVVRVPDNVFVFYDWLDGLGAARVIDGWIEDQGGYRLTIAVDAGCAPWVANAIQASKYMDLVADV